MLYPRMSLMKQISKVCKFISAKICQELIEDLLSSKCHVDIACIFITTLISEVKWNQEKTICNTIQVRPHGDFLQRSRRAFH